MRQKYVKQAQDRLKWVNTDQKGVKWTKKGQKRVGISKIIIWIRNFQLSKQKITKFPKITSKTDFLVFLLYLATYFTPTFFIIVNIIAIHDVLKVQTLFYISLLLSKKNNLKICKRRLILPH